MAKDLYERGVLASSSRPLLRQSRKGLEFVLQAQTIWVCCSSQGILSQHGIDERRFSVCQRCMGSHGP